VKLRRRRRLASTTDPIIATVLLGNRWCGDAEGISVALGRDRVTEVTVRNGDQLTTWRIERVAVQPWEAAP
jgi:hypothetical protein